MGQHYDILRPLMPTAQLPSRKVVPATFLPIMDKNVCITIALLRAESISYIIKIFSQFLRFYFAFIISEVEHFFPQSTFFTRTRSSFHSCIFFTLERKVSGQTK